MEKLEGQPGEFTAVIATAGGPVSVEVGAVVLASGWVPLDEKYLAPMGLGVSPKVVHAAQFGKMLVAGEVTARRIAFVLDTTLAEEAVRKAAEDTRDWQRQLCRDLEGKFLKTIQDSGKCRVNEDVDKEAFAKATRGVWDIYTKRFGDDNIKAVLAVK